jgi:predicted amino acid racemase
MNKVTIDLNILKHNIDVIDQWMTGHGASWTLVTKVLCGHSDTIKGLHKLGVSSMADSRLSNLRSIKKVIPHLESWYLRLPHFSAIKGIVSLADVSLNSEIKTIEELNREAKNQDKVHGIIVMIELGDLREGILPGALIDFYNHIFGFPNINVLGIGSNLGCLAGSVPNEDQLMQLVLYRELLELKFNHKLPMISSGTSSILPLLLEEKLPRAINHFRIGEAVFLGSDLVNGGTLKDLRDDAITLEVEIVEIKEKNLVPLGETGSETPFESLNIADFSPGQRGYRAIVAVGQLDTEVSGLTPLNPDYKLAGASSDLTVVNVGENPEGLKVGGTLKFRVNYAALLRLMSNRYIDQIVTPDLDEFYDGAKNDDDIRISTLTVND